MDLDQGEVVEHGSAGLYLLEVARLDAANVVRAHVAYVSPGGVLGLHPTRFWQVFCVVAGEGWVRVRGEERQRIEARQAVLWAPGEVHESGSDVGMTVVIVASSERLSYGEQAVF